MVRGRTRRGAWAAPKGTALRADRTGQEQAVERTWMPWAAEDPAQPVRSTACSCQVRRPKHLYAAIRLPGSVRRQRSSAYLFHQPDIS